MSDPLTIIHGDALSSLRRLPDESVQSCVTSPPYWALRDYGVEPLVWDETVLAGAPVGGVVLDPFAGSGTTGKVAIELGRKAILIEPKAEYVEMIKRRCQTTIGLPITA